METYYVVKKGYNVGIFKTWAECKKSVSGYKNPIFRKFNTYDEASLFFKEKSNSNSNSNNIKVINTTSKNKEKTNNINNTIDSILDNPISESQVSNTHNTTNSTNSISDEEFINLQKSLSTIKSSHYSTDLNYNVKQWTIIDDEIYIFTDGSSRKSQFPNDFNSGFGVFLNLKCTNIKEQYTDNKTNNQCELMALDYTFKLIVRYYRELSEINKVIKIVSDSEYSIKCISVWLSAWKKNNWKTAKGEDVKNRDLIESIDASMLRIKLINSKIDASKKIKVKLIHVNSHQPMDKTDRTKFYIWYGNFCADLLACNKI
jgi:ribonuclease HI